ncbi:hypothetical protein DSCO28_23400 [Desulfosarcina ovata subsp. sediminis]|uniref:Sigma-54-dependent Fis family transcriptional regulator n=1 Tax=Desulfosarcina ovata subsp. sediminis TaxID=885957 RepID=A0A5K7ZK69_9BACT|nr:sigma 54-interacting transcriptional regulator [Desulfosarcina ovata]BBO81774.1 hypothetical protein DSCO28_23400 [Desulfosarcina ovata subsp. sediminis]
MREEDLNFHWKTVVNTIRDGIMIVDRMGQIISVNRAFETITGYRRSEAIGQSCQLLHCDICQSAHDPEDRSWCNLFRTGRIDANRCTLIRKDRRPVHVIKNASLLHGATGKVIGAVETLTDVTELVRREDQIQAFRQELHQEDGFSGILGASPAISRVFELVRNAARSDAPVIILGESGTGKELVARAIHDVGIRKAKPFVKVNCAALNESLLESELFGHVKGAFTGAFRDREGRFEAAHHGEIFIDEIGDLPPHIQVKLLRVLEEKVVERVGTNQPMPIDVRIISATHRNLDAMVAEGAFRKDLFYRINVIPIWVPPLRERLEDIPLLAESFLKGISLKTGKTIPAVSPEAMALLANYPWPGNVRELKSAFEYACVTCHENRLEYYHFPPNIVGQGSISAPRHEPGQSREETQRQQLITALQQTGGNRTAAAKILGVTRVTVWNRMKRFGIQLPL